MSLEKDQKIKEIMGNLSIFSMMNDFEMRQNLKQAGFSRLRECDDMS